MWRTEMNKLMLGVQCSICTDFFKDPVVHECGQTFCRGCLPAVTADGTAICNHCLQEICPGSYNDDRQLGNIVDHVRRLNQVLDTGKPLCAHHREALKYYCEEDEELLCETCAQSQRHLLHHRLIMEEAMDSFKFEMESELCCLTEKRRNINILKNQQKMHILDLKALFQQLEQDMTEEFQKLHDFLSREEGRMRQKLNVIQESQVEDLESMMAIFLQESRILKNDITMLGSQMQKEGPNFFKTLGTTLNRCRPVFSKPFVIVPDLSFLGKFNGPLKYRVWRKMKTFCAPGSKVTTVDTQSISPILDNSAHNNGEPDMANEDPGEADEIDEVAKVNEIVMENDVYEGCNMHEVDRKHKVNERDTVGEDKGDNIQEIDERDKAGEENVDDDVEEVEKDEDDGDEDEDETDENDRDEDDVEDEEDEDDEDYGDDDDDDDDDYDEEDSEESVENEADDIDCPIRITPEGVIVSSGRYYWEMNTSVHSEFGVHTKLPHHPDFLDKPSYLLILEQDTSMCTIDTDPPTLITLWKEPRKIGMYLDCDEGQLSFYGITDNVSHIHTFKEASLQNETVYLCLKSLVESGKREKGLRIIHV